MESPDKFESQDPLEAALQEQSEDKLLEIILTMVDRHPDLERLVRLSSTSISAAIDLEELRSQIQSVFQDMGSGRHHDRDPYCVVQEVADDLEPFFTRADDYRQHDRFHDATTVDRLLIEEIRDHYDQFYDEEGELSSRVSEASTTTSCTASPLPAASLRKPTCYEWPLFGFFCFFPQPTHLR